MILSYPVCHCHFRIMVKERVNRYKVKEFISFILNVYIQLDLLSRRLMLLNCRFTE